MIDFKNKLTSENVLVTPEMAKKMLATSLGNRKLSKTKIRQYARDMSLGKWALNGETIVFDEGGHLTNGHHRLEGCVLAGVPVWFTIIRGVDPSCFPTYDSGYNRKTSQSLEIAGIANSTSVAATLSHVKELQMSGRLDNNKNKVSMNYTRADFLDFYYQDSLGYQEAVKVGRFCYDKARVFGVAFIAALYYYLTHDLNWPVDLTKRFFVAVHTIGQNDIPIANLLTRKMLEKKLSRGTTVTMQYQFTLFAKAWNKYVSNETVSRLSYDPTKEDIPTLLSNKNKNLFS